MKQGLQRQKEAYSSKWRDLEERARGLEDALRSQRQAVLEREEQNTGLHAQVGGLCMLVTSTAQAQEQLQAGSKSSPAPAFSTRVIHANHHMIDATDLRVERLCKGNAQCVIRA